MKSKFYNIIAQVSGDEEQELAIALLDFHTEFHSIIQEENRLIVSYDSTCISEEVVKSILTKEKIISDYIIEYLEDKNWNEASEQAFQPIVLADRKWSIRASFHPSQHTENEIVINPKMSFGTGHHETTKQMMEMMTTIEFNHKKVWDYGCGTGILAIMAEKLGATYIIANDIEEWAYKNAVENVEINTCTKTKLIEGDIAIAEQQGLSDHKYDIVLANITKNILLESALKINQYATSGTVLLMSGFYTQDISDIETHYNQYNFYKSSETSHNNWACVKFVKQ